MAQPQRVGRRQRRKAQPPVALYDLSDFAMGEFAHIVKEEKKGRLRGSELKQQVRSLDSTRLETPCTFFMYIFGQHKRAGDEWFSKPFYTAPKGYKLSLGVYANGEGDSEGEYVSVFLHLMPGEFDDRPWPFRGSFNVTLLDQSDNEQDIEEEISFGYGTPEAVAGRPREGRENDGWGEPEFISHSELHARSRRRDSPVYVKHDSICFQVTKNY